MTSTYEGLRPCTERTVDDSGRILCGLMKGSDREVSVNLCRACPVPQINCQHLRAAMQKKVSTPITVRFATGRVEVWDDEGPIVGFKQAACAVKTMPIHSARDCAGCSLRLPHSVPSMTGETARHISVPIAPRASSSRLVAAPPEQKGRPPNNHATSQIPQGLSDADTGTGELIVRRARAVASKNARQLVQADACIRTEGITDPDSAEPLPKIILFQQWLAGQLNRKNPAVDRATPTPEGDGVEEITYSPIPHTYQEESEYERCVGWTD
jgi:hypothetical protein